jgi:hypothetical protein
MEVSLHFLSLIHTHTRTHQIQHKYRFAVIPDQTLSFFSLTSLHSHQDRKDGARGTTVGTKRSEGESRNKVSSMEWTLATHTHTHTHGQKPQRHSLVSRQDFRVWDWILDCGWTGWNSRSLKCGGSAARKWWRPKSYVIHSSCKTSHVAITHATVNHFSQMSGWILARCVVIGDC